MKFGHSVIRQLAKLEIEAEDIESKLEYKKYDLTNCLNSVATCCLYRCYNILVFLTTVFTNITQFIWVPNTTLDLALQPSQPSFILLTLLTG